MTEPTKTTCPYCGVGCGVLVTPQTDGTLSVRGDPDHPANLGRLCSKGAALGETLGTAGRLLHPTVAGEQVSWDQALDQVAGRLGEIVAEHGPGAVAFYVSGQLLTEDYYVANKLMKGFIGGANIDTNSRLCMASSVAGYKRALGADTVPCDYADLESAELIVLVGSNTAWCHPVVYQRIKQAKQAHPDRQIVVIDPRRTATCEIADLHLSIAPGTDTLLFNGLLNWLRREDALDWTFLESHTEGFAAAFTAARESAGSVPRVAAACGIPESDLADFYRRFARTERVVTLYSQGVNQWSFGTDKVNAIINCHLATGRIGRPGMGPFSITGQPNAMGGREVGGLANQLAAHMDFAPDDVDRVRRFWHADGITREPGLKAVEMMRAVEEGNIKAIWVMATNPAVSMPDADRVRAALQACELVICSDLFAGTDTARCADVLLPAAGWGEKDGTVTNSERCISRQRAFLDPPGEARPDWWILTEVARRMGFADAFPYRSAAEVFREHAALSAFENDGRRDFDIGAIADLAATDYDRLPPVQWPLPAGREAARLFADGRFYTPNGKARFIAITPRPPATAPDEDYPLVLNTGRIRDQWHTMTRTGLAPRLSSHIAEPFVQIHPVDAAAHGLGRGGIAELTSRWGRMLARIDVDADQRPGSVFVPMHWSDMLARQARADALVNPVTDPVSGQPEFKHTPVQVRLFRATWYGIALSRERLPIPDGMPQDGAPPQLDYCVAIPDQGFWRTEIAGREPITAWADRARDLFGADGEWLDFADVAHGRYRGARILDGRLAACLFIAPTPNLPSSRWLGELFGAAQLDTRARTGILAGRPPRGQVDAGEIVCACFTVGRTRIEQAIRGEGLRSAEAIGACLQAGTNCGSCLPELGRILEQTLDRGAA
ncbi:nitrate reductase [Thiocapsa roseopersicina]|uniref:Assimilatory nitrate reductase (NADH) alpha subunit apoprotein n=1 Tax=Thiocapsa roseopersicina TaxID=1058 RepID=A0A1H3D6J9_THIRO|nr:nitrate reductase [Thiocapsa roseopersicina]SDX61940.1 assimilatory nitrate reductase (NADH) alpha subunit apoprotein [Thiocapsa roseopersicina]